MDKVIDLIASMVSPGKTWGCFFRKTLSTLLVASIGAYGFNVYQRMERSHWESLPLHTAVKEGDTLQKVQLYLEGLIQRDSTLKSVWIYSWPDARTIIPVAHDGLHSNPLPLGYFLPRDAEAIGVMTFSQCDWLDRPGTFLYACPIEVENDQWGVIVFELKVSHDDTLGLYLSLAHKLSNIIYNNHHD